MIIKGTSAKSGIMEYLADGLDRDRVDENGEFIKRDDMDIRTTIDGDFDLTSETINYINEEKNYKTSYYHEVLSVKEDLTDEEICEIYKDAKKWLLAGHEENSHAAYAEIHRPKENAKYKLRNLHYSKNGGITFSYTMLSEKQYQDIVKNNPEQLQYIEKRYTHVHFVIPKVDLQRDIQLKISENMNEKYVEDKNNLQRYIDTKYKLQSWEDSKSFTDKEKSKKETIIERMNPDDERLKVSKKKDNLINEISEKISSNEIKNFDELLNFVKNKDGLTFLDFKTKEKFPNQTERIKVRFNGETQDSNLRSSFFQKEFWKQNTLDEIKEQLKNRFSNTEINKDRKLGNESFEEIEKKYNEYIATRTAEVEKRNSFQNKELSKKLDMQLREEAINFKYDYTMQTSKEKIIQDLESGNAVFLTGGAGVGKSYTTRLVIEDYEKQGKSVMKLGSTGIAGMNIGGQTYASKLMLGIDNDFKKVLEKDKGRTEKVEKLKEELSKTSLIVFDECSMISGKQFDIIKARLEQLDYKGKILVVGDLAQLSPVEKKKKENNKDDLDLDKEVEKKDPDYIFKSKAWESLNTKTHSLYEIKRSDDKDWSEVLNQLRVGAVTEKGEQLLNSLKNNENFKETAETVFLCATNAKVNEINDAYLDSLAGQKISFTSVVTDETGEKVEDLSLKKQIFDETYHNEILDLKVGAIVMLRENNTKMNYVNGDRGIFKGIDKDGRAFVENERTGKTVVLEKSNTSVEIEVSDNKFETFKVKNYPFVLAKAMTIHKSQGLGFKSSVMDLNGATNKGQAYVAISRLMKFDNSKIILDDKIWKFGKMEKQTFKDIFKVDNEVIDFINPNLRSKELKVLDAQLKKSIDKQNQNFMKMKKIETKLENKEEFKQELTHKFFKNGKKIDEKKVEKFLIDVKKIGLKIEKIDEIKSIFKEIKKELKKPDIESSKIQAEIKRQNEEENIKQVNKMKL